MGILWYLEVSFWHIPRVLLHPRVLRRHSRNMADEKGDSSKLAPDKPKKFTVSAVNLNGNSQPENEDKPKESSKSGKTPSRFKVNRVEFADEPPKILDSEAENKQNGDAENPPEQKNDFRKRSRQESTCSTTSEISPPLSPNPNDSYRYGL